ncbi:PIR Superfamily Protein [Plasmodium ovale wallikeri]|uniref:PIR Superfamily Protein n=1 Tax=Plasmodium ovale wallikeri TaxID=864142 RepID=A0A1A9AD14_PLAOA|nr:PIR Superfamily Protein [Plasmodium ovale wallikeri]
MSSHGYSEYLPANDFDDKWKTATNFLQFENAVILEENIDNMEKWIKHFDGQIVQIYDGQSIDISKNMQDKRCRDLNYYINYVLHYITRITKNTENVTEIISDFQKFLDAKFNAWKLLSNGLNFKCERDKKDYTSKMEIIKKLDDYCENKNAFKEKLAQYDKTTCCKYSNHVKERKLFFHNVISSYPTYKNDSDFHIDDNCTLKNFGKIFPNIICNGGIMTEIETDELPFSYGYGYSYGYQQPMSSGANPEESFNNSPTKIAFTSVSTLLGACLSGLYLYRHSFIGNMLRNVQNRNIISHENTYDEISEMISEVPSQYLDNPENSNRFYIAYDPMNN